MEDGHQIKESGEVLGDVVPFLGVCTSSNCSGRGISITRPWFVPFFRQEIEIRDT